jgi:hypothetical protein
MQIIRLPNPTPSRISADTSVEDVSDGCVSPEGGRRSSGMELDCVTERSGSLADLRNGKVV